MNVIQNIKNSKITTVLSVVALFIAIGGSATAANKLIHGKSIKPGTITAKQIKNKTITKSKLAPAAVSALKGPQGPAGEPGEKGPAGPQGVAGPKVVNTYSVSKSTGNVAANEKVIVASLNNLPSGKYMVIAKSLMFAQSAGSTVRCSIETNNNGGGDEAQWTSPVNASRTTVPLVLSTATKVTQVRVDCDPGDSLGSFNVRIVAVPVA